MTTTSPASDVSFELPGDEYFLSGDESDDLIARLEACGFDLAEACSMLSACVYAIGATPAERARAVVAARERDAARFAPVRGWRRVEPLDVFAVRSNAYRDALLASAIFADERPDPRDFTREAWARRSGA